MSPGRGLRTAALVLWLAAWVLVAWGMLGPAPADLPGQTDKLVHFACFLAISVAALGFCRRSGELVAVGLVCLAAAVGLELAQGLVPRRAVESGDMAANLAGVALGMAVAGLAQRRLGRRRLRPVRAAV